MVFTKNPAKLEARAQGYEMRGNQAKALKCRQKIAKLTGMSPLQQQQGYGQQGLIGQQYGQTGLTGQQTMLGQQQPILMGQQQQPILMGQQTGLMGQQTGLMGQQQLLQQQQLQQQQTLLAGGPMINAPFAWQTTNTPARYEANALKWERRGNYNKAQKNRGKVWRLQNPTLAAQAPATPVFYGQSNQFLGYNQPIAQPTMMSTQQATQVETIVRPTIVQETMRPERIVEVQPIVHREIEAPQVRIVEKHMYETVPSAGPSTMTNAPIIQETVKPRIIEEIQPVVHREVPAPFVEKVEQHVTEHIVNPTVMTKEVVQGGQVQPQFVAAGGIQNTTTTTTTTTTGTQQQQQQGGLMGKVQNALHHNRQ